MFKFTAYAFVAALLAAGLAVPTVAFAECGAQHSTKSVDASTPDSATSIADSSTQQSTQPGK